MELDDLAELIWAKREELLTSWRQQVRELPSAQGLDIPTLNDHMPRLIGELATALERGSGQTIPQAIAADIVKSNPTDSAKIHGLQRLEDDFDIEEVVAEYNILRGCVHDLATEHGFVLQGKIFHVINRVFDHAIGLALKSYSNQRAKEVRVRREEYLSFVAHDLQTPLVAIALAGRVLERSLPVKGYGSDSAQILKTLRRSVEQLEALVQRVLEENASLHTETGVRLVCRTFDLWPLVESLVEELQPIADATGTTIRNEVPDELVIYADAGFLKRVFQNLIANAIKCTPGGIVKVGAATRSEESLVECWVKDNGKGIPEDMLARVFDGEANRLESDGPADGTGLGLTIVRTFTEAHGGTVSVDSKLGHGAAFRFSLPFKINC
jgi:two-component system phosphate regulon sensor histidine kinase PhoR